MKVVQFLSTVARQLSSSGIIVLKREMNVCINSPFDRVFQCITIFLHFLVKSSYNIFIEEKMKMATLCPGKYILCCLSNKNVNNICFSTQFPIKGGQSIGNLLAKTM